MNNNTSNILTVLNRSYLNRPCTKTELKHISNERNNIVFINETLAKCKNTFQKNELKGVRNFYINLSSNTAGVQMRNIFFQYLSRGICPTI